MSDLRKYVAVKVTRLSAAISASDTTCTVAEIKDREGNTLAMTDFGTKAWGVIDPGGDQEEMFSFTGISSTTLSGCSNVAMKTPYTESSGFTRAHAAGVRVVIYTNAPAVYNEFGNRLNDETITQTWTFTDPNLPRVDTYNAPTDDEQFATKAYVDATATGSTNVDKVIVSGTAGTTVAAGDVLYFDETALEWLKADASATGTCENALLGLARGAGTDGNPISGGVLLMGKDANQAGFTAGDSVFISDTAGDLASSAGTVSVQVGYAIAADTIYFTGSYFKSILTQERKALVDAITASASEINQLDGATITASQLTEAGTFFGSTDISGAEAETLTDGSNADALHIHSSVTNPWKSGYAKFTMDEDKSITAYNNVGTAGATALSISCQSSSGAGRYGGFYLSSFVIAAGDVDWDSDMVWRCLVKIKQTGLNQDGYFGLGMESGFAADSTSTTRHIGFYLQDSSLYASAADGTTQSKSSALSLTLTDSNEFTIVYTAGSDAKFYINGTLAATINTNLPTGNTNFNPLMMVMYDPDGVGGSKDLVASGSAELYYKLS